MHFAIGKNSSCIIRPCDSANVCLFSSSFCSFLIIPYDVSVVYFTVCNISVVISCKTAKIFCTALNTRSDDLIKTVCRSDYAAILYCTIIFSGKSSETSILTGRFFFAVYRSKNIYSVNRTDIFIDQRCCRMFQRDRMVLFFSVFCITALDIAIVFQAVKIWFCQIAYGNIFFQYNCSMQIITLQQFCSHFQLSL